MGFYADWKNNYGNDKKYIVDFLNKSVESTLVLESGDKDEVDKACEILGQISISEFIDALSLLNFDRSVLPADVPQYSSFSDGVVRVPELLEFEPDGMSFEKMGYQLVRAANKSACVKYGENHSKLASIFGLVTITTSKPKKVRSTAIGKALVCYPLEQKKSILQKLILREYIVQKMIHEAIEGEVFYRNVVGSLKESTAARRRNNTRYLLEFVLNESDYQHLLLNVDWFGW